MQAAVVIVKVSIHAPIRDTDCIQIPTGIGQSRSTTYGDRNECDEFPPGAL
jgi:hypothetical protein